MVSMTFWSAHRAARPISGGIVPYEPPTMTYADRVRCGSWWFGSRAGIGLFPLSGGGRGIPVVAGPWRLRAVTELSALDLLR